MSTLRLIAKNTAFLYVRMLLIMGVTLFTSRIVLNVLGVVDYGVYSLVGGIVILFSFFNSSMTSATQRFLAYDIGRDDSKQLSKTFNATLNIHIAISILFFFLAETVGLWCVNYFLKFPDDRMSAVNWIYQFSILTFVVSIIQVPYDALIISREKLNIYAYMSIFEVFLKLLIVYFLVIFDVDKLILYAVLIFFVSFVSSLTRKIYCKIYFKETKYFFYYDKELYGKLISFSGWSLFGNIAGVARGEGSNVLLNIFFGATLNAAYGISMQVQSAVQIFVTNFQMAVNPQIIKQYAVGNKEKSLSLIFQSSKFSYFLMLIIASPIIYNIDYILRLWLENPPKYTSVFVVLCLINILIDCISGPLVVGAQATGVIKWYQITIGTLIFLCLPISYFALKIFNQPKIIFIIIIMINIFSLFARLIFLKFLINLNLKSFFLEVLLKVIIVTLIVLGFGHFFIIYMFSPITNFILNSFFLTFVNLISIYFTGLNKKERFFLFSFLKKKTS